MGHTVYIPIDGLVEVETCSRNTSHKLLFIIDSVIYYIKFSMTVNTFLITDKLYPQWTKYFTKNKSCLDGLKIVFIYYYRKTNRMKKKSYYYKVNKLFVIVVKQ